MKKRLLSAALAVAMMLTMLPLSAFAADPTEGLASPESGVTTVGYYSTALASSATNSGHGVGWYFSTTNEAKQTIWNPVSSGVIASTSTSGIWYSDINAALEANKTSLKVISNQSSVNLGLVSSGTSVSIDVFGHDVAFSTTLKQNQGDTTTNTKVTGLTLTNTATTSGKPTEVAVTGSITATDQAFSFTATNINTSSTASGEVTISLTNNHTTTKQLSVTLTNSKVGDITTTNAYATINAKDSGSKTGNIAINVEDGCAFDTGSSSITVTGGTAGTVSLTGKGTITVSDMGEVGALTLMGQKKSGNTTSKWGGSITVNISGQSKVASISEGSGNNSAHTINITNGGTDHDVGDITMTESSQLHKISVTGGKTGAIAQNAGTLSITGGSAVGAVTLGSTDSTGTLTVTVSGDTTTVDGLTVAGSSNVDPTVNISGGTFNGAVSLGSNYTKKTISGGTFSTSIKTQTGWLKSFTYEIATTAGSSSGSGGSSDPTSTAAPDPTTEPAAPTSRDASGTTYTYTDSFQDVVDAYKNGNAVITTVGSSTSTNSVYFFVDVEPNKGSGGTGAITDSTNATVVINTAPTVGIQLPSTVNGKSISTWYVGDGAAPWNPGGVLIATSNTYVTTDTTLGSVGDIVDVRLKVGSNTGNEGLSVSLSGSTIQVSGGLRQDAAPIENIVIEVQTADGSWRTVHLGYITTGTGAGKLQFVEDVTNDTMIQGVTTSGNTAIQVKGATTVWALSGSGLSILNGSVALASLSSGDAVATSSVSGVGTNEKDNLITALGKTTADFSGSTAIAEAANKIMAGLSDSQVTSYLTTARTAAAKDENGTTTVTAAQINAMTEYNKVQVVVYLNIQATAWTRTGSNHSLTLNITPYYRIDVTTASGNASSGNTKAAYTVKTGAALPMTGVTAEYGEVDVDLVLPSSFSSTTDLYAHHGNYVYEVDTTSVSGHAKFTTLHGFSPFVINTAIPVAMREDTSTPKKTYHYDSLQTAVDEAEDGDTITLNPNYTGATTISVTGKARTFYVDPLTNGNLTLTFSGANVTADKTNGTKWTVQLNSDNITTPTVTPATISVASVANGTARTNVSTAQAGDTVTITSTPNTGYIAGAPVVRYNTSTATNQSVGVASSGTNTWTFTVPEGALTVTVTPSFTVDDGRIFPDVDPSAWYADAVKNCYDTMIGNNHLMSGNANGTFTPDNQLDRAQMVQILWNLAGQPAVTGTCPFPDVAGTYYDWATAPITWAASKGYVIGYPDGKFHPEVNIARQDMILILYRYIGGPSSLATGNLSAYYDGSSVGDWATEAMRWAVAANILSGTNSVSLNGYLSAATKANRKDAAVTLWQYYSRYGTYVAP